MTSVNRYSFISFPIWMQFMSLFCLIALSGTYNTLLKAMVKMDIIVFFLILRGKLLFQSFTIEYKVTYVFFMNALYHIKKIPFYS